VLASRLARRRDIVSRPPENILSTATAEPRDVGHSEIPETRLKTYQEYPRYREQDRPGLGIELVDLSTSESDYMCRNLQEGV